ncbi:AsmA-like protein [Rhodobacter aestuarii]|uniref:AsmA-like C-terminal region n=1 Tax=Rhodobacter aestuarii TaxID=453582 RepID=A0A1N7J7J4_9RHOB|nr:AsmA-like C-terminal region-containing protein [Rhodobacter aestuarii]PTV97106.1 AsmA-like protein [Rhodobacter aestuarii]SIS45206.1 AsmA-like C-terminal region [Rhodobacter aestuarii]
MNESGADPAKTVQPPAQPEAGATMRPARRRKRRLVSLVFGVPILVLLLGLAGLIVTHTPVPVPQLLLSRVEAQVNTALAGRLGVRIGAAAVVVAEGLVPEVRLDVVRANQPSGLPIAVLPELAVRFDLGALLSGRLAPESLRIGGARVALYRRPDGSIDLALPEGEEGALAGLDLTDPTKVTEAIETFFATPLLASVDEITAEDLHIRLVDTRLGRVWEVSQGRFRLRQTNEDISLTLGFDVGERDRLPAQVALTASTSKFSPRAAFGAAVTEVPAADLAVQSPALAVLGLLDAPISGTIQSGITETGELERLDATLRIGAGALRPVEGAQPVAFDSADLRLRYDPAAQRVQIDRLDLQSRALRLGASGQVLLRDVVNGLPGAALAQVALHDIAADPEGLFEKPALISEGALDLRLQLDPFRIDVGQVQLVEGARRVAGRGKVAAGPEGWSVAFDAEVGEIASDDLLALWPKALVPPTRDWIEKNVTTGQLRNVRAAVRLQPQAEPRLELGYEFRGAEVKVLNTLPPVREGRGFAGITENQHTLMVEEGRLEAPQGGGIEVADSVMTVPDIRQIPAAADVRLVTRSPIPAALSLLDEEPFRFLSKAGRDTDIAEGWAEARTDLHFLLEKKILAEDVEFNVIARLTDVRSTTLVPGHEITAPLFKLVADRAGMTVSGAGHFDVVPFQGRWTQRFGPEHRGTSRVDGFVEVTPEALDHLKIGLPEGAVKGEGWGHLDIAFAKDEAPRYRFKTDLKGLRLSIPEIGWSKAAATEGQLELTGSLGKVATVDRLVASAPGLATTGKVVLTATGFERAIYDSLKIGRWFEGAAELVARGAGRAPDVVVKSGRLDLRALPNGSGGSGGKGGGKITAQLDRVTVTDGIALTGLAGNFTTRGGFAGDFTARVNGAAAVRGAVIPQAGRAAIRLTAQDGGAVLDAAGIFSKARGGAMDLTLRPVGDKSYDGALKIADLKVRDAPVLASMLSAASVIGLLEQLNGDGITFNEVTGDFRIAPNGVTVRAGEALGASMGVTMTGVYYPETKAFNMEGVVSPFYIVNAIGQIFARKGEGLFGFTYRLGGTAEAPKISINPLSILTPGMFREIFRRSPPPIVTE